MLNKDVQYKGTISVLKHLVIFIQLQWKQYLHQLFWAEKYIYINELNGTGMNK